MNQVVTPLLDFYTVAEKQREVRFCAFDCCGLSVLRCARQEIMAQERKYSSEMKAAVGAL